MPQHADIKVTISKDGTGQAIKLTDTAIRRLISESTGAVHGEAMNLLGEMVYDTPPKPSYPVRTGHLLNSLGSVTHLSGDPLGEVFDTADYAIYVHEGTRHMHPRPFLTDALEWERRRTPARARRIARQLGLDGPAGGAL